MYLFIMIATPIFSESKVNFANVYELDLICVKKNSLLYVYHFKCIRFELGMCLVLKRHYLFCLFYLCN